MKKSILLSCMMCVTLSLAAADAFTVRAWAGFPKKLNRQGSYDLLFKGDRSAEVPRAQYILGMRSGYPEFKYLDAKGHWGGFVLERQEQLVMHMGQRKTVPCSQLPNIKDGDAWQQIVGVYDHGAITLYLNGKLAYETQTSQPEPPKCAQDPQHVGYGEFPGGDEAFRFPGDIRFHAYEEKALSAAEIASLYEKERQQLAGVTPQNKLVYPLPPIKGVLPMTQAHLDTAKQMPRKANCTSKIVKVNGIPRVCIDGEVISGMAMMPSPHVDNAAVTFSCNDFNAAGIRLFSNIFWGAEPQNKWWLGEGKYDWAYYDARLKAMIDAAPNGWVFPRIKMDPPPWWRKQHEPDEYFAKQVRADSQAWKKLRDRMLTDVITHIENSPLAPHVVGYHIGALSGTEWIVFDDKVSKQVRAMNRTERLAHFDHRSKIAADALLDAAALVKRLVNRQKIVGSFFGYSFIEQRDAARVYASPDLDFFAAPHSYGHRRGGMSGRSNVFALASARLHNKIFWMESDDRTVYAQTDEPYRCNSLKESVDVLKRAMGFTLAEGWETWWFLLVGNDTFHDETLMKAIQQGQNEAVRHGLNAPARTEADVAIFRRVQELDYGPFAPDSKKTNLYGYDAFCRVYPLSGVAYDVYMFEDVCNPNLPDYKVYVFNDAKTISPAERAAIERLVKRRGKTAIWMNADKEAVVNAPEGWTQVDFTQPPQPKKLRATFAKAGAHIWMDSDDFVLPGRGYVMVHAKSSGEKRVTLPAPADLVEVFGAEPDRQGVTTFTDKFYKGETRIYRMKPAQR